MAEEARPSVSLGALARVALGAGLVGFGGGFAIIARLRHVMVYERRWLTEDEFVERIGVAGALPGTIVTNLLVLVGYRLRGIAGALVAPLVFIVPGCAVIALLAAEYDLLHGTRAVRAALDGMSPAVAGLFAAIALDLGRATLRTALAAAIAVLSAVALALRWLSLLEVVTITGALGALGARAKHRDGAALFAWGVLPAAAVSLPLSLSLLAVFARIGAATFGGGIAMVPAMEHEAISRGWLDAQTFADAIALGQVTPGPVGNSATFVGWRVAGPLGALAATVGVFAPPVVIALVAARSLAAFRESRLVQGFLRGITPAVVGIIAAAAVSMGRASVHGWIHAGILVACAAARVAAPKASPLWPLLAGAAAGLIGAAVRGELVL